MRIIKILFFYLSVTFLLSIAIINCSDEIVTNTENQDFKFPFKDGSHWNYKKIISVSDIRPDSIAYYYVNYPFVITGTVTILYDTVINSVLTKCFLDDILLDNQNHFYNRYYFINNDTAMILYSSRIEVYNNYGFPLGIISNSTMEDDNLHIVNKEISKNKILTDTVKVMLKYPVETGKEWSYTTNVSMFVKKYLGFENVTTPAGTVNCMKLRSEDNAAPSDFYYSKYGLIKQYQLLDNILVSSAQNPDGIGYIDLTYDVNVLSFYIP